MRDDLDNEGRASALRVAFSLVMLLAGALTVSLTKDLRGFWVLLQQIGLAFIVAGVVSLFNELVLERWRKKPVDTSAAGTMPRSGMTMISYPRQGFWRYHTWYLNTAPQELFFAGRSVLHRIQADFRTRVMPSVEDALLRKLREGSKIKILFCNPTWTLIPQLAEAEAQPERGLLSDLATSLGIVQKLWGKLQSETLPGELEIRLYEELTQYAYHWTQNLQTGEKEMLVGFYFARLLGCKSPLFEVNDESVQSEFQNHFGNVFAKAKKLLDYPRSGQGKEFDLQLFEAVTTHLAQKLGAAEVQRLMGQQ